MANVAIRTARPGDAETILEVKQAAITELSASAYTREQVTAWTPSDSALAEYRTATETATFQILVACDTDQVVGYGVLNVEQDQVEALFVRPSWARLGVGTRLLRQLEASATLGGCRELTVVSSRNAVGFYESHEYVRLDTQSRVIGDVELEFVVLSKQLTR